MILILNCMLDDQLAKSFDNALLRPLETCNQSADFILLKDTSTIPPLANYSHVIISGSEASAMDHNSWNDALTETIQQAVTLQKPILGICYGHQFLARCLAGINSISRSKTSEFGWANIRLTPNPLFAGLNSNLITMVSHYDEVVDLDNRFKVIASSDKCNIHAFQYQDLPVWGVQFHPEYNMDESNEIFEKISDIESNFESYFDNTLGNLWQDEPNRRILVNFFSQD